ncbi:MAG: hypothetical protein N3F10_02830 [Candidatus Bathyarchaeota archaeon]|nr:hypothetical protein [Candidatus Bathyarchaeota archaeon]MCX8177217.1 hypothetical protein [Candidatus Bathyarchaeota archaeon]MDW8193540.1 hypothetical protein [Nitrososphaerota archaeon]
MRIKKNAGEGIGEGVMKVRSWAEFKQLAESLRPNAIVYNIEQDGLSPKRELTILRLILPAGPAYYIMIDSSRDGERLRDTGIPLRRDAKGNRYLEEEDVVKFLREQFKRKDLLLCSYWTI